MRFVRRVWFAGWRAGADSTRTDRAHRSNESDSDSRTDACDRHTVAVIRDNTVRAVTNFTKHPQAQGPADPGLFL
jgi:hypothetical protein